MSRFNYWRIELETGAGSVPSILPNCPELQPGTILKSKGYCAFDLGFFLLDAAFRLLYYAKLACPISPFGRIFETVADVKKLLAEADKEHAWGQSTFSLGSDYIFIGGRSARLEIVL